MKHHQPQGASGPPRSLDLVDAASATARLGISRASLYSYVSRGLVRSFASPRGPRERLYALDDVEALIRRRTRLRRPLVAAATALDWGLPVLETRLTRVENGRLYYRDRDAVALSARAMLEEAAALLIPGLDPESLRAPPAEPSVPGPPGHATAAFLSRALRLLADIGAEEAPDAGRAAATVLLRVARAAGAGGPGSVHETLGRAWGLGPAGADAVRRALVLCADHELSSSAFAVRVAASTGATLGASIVAGLAALSGPSHGGATDRARRLIEEAAAPEGRRLLEHLRAGERVAGFGHHLYPDGDPRAAALLDILPEASGPARSDRSLIRAIAEATGQRPSLDIALVALERAHGLPRGAAFALFAVGRTVGWLAHAVEQRAQGTLIRPRARYVAP